MLSDSKHKSLIEFDNYCKENNLEVELIVIDGSTCILKYGEDRKVYGINVTSTEYYFITGLNLDSYGISIVPIGLLNLPQHYEDRLQEVGGFNKLGVCTLGAMDLIMIKLSRGGPRDIQDCKEIIRKEGLERSLCIGTYNEWKLNYVGNLDMLDRG